MAGEDPRREGVETGEGAPLRALGLGSARDISPPEEELVFTVKREGEGGTLKVLVCDRKAELCSGGIPGGPKGGNFPLEWADAECEEKSTGTGMNTGSV